MIGSLRYLTHTRPDFVFSVKLLSRFMEHSTFEHMLVVNRVLKYIKGTLNYGLVYDKGQDVVKLIDYTDNDFAGDVEEDQRSTTGQVFYFRSMAISWSSKK
ncbi:unnamed protein product [Spirodela intermedia]|uniref:Uncharacterized protein n=1 Tax=Spirodela intermedia TaxID=51605 RepID=A0A7I8JX91_SPIIN|nr:unnamed protein product [Spirodela intermedia]